MKTQVCWLLLNEKDRHSKAYPGLKPGKLESALFNLRNKYKNQQEELDLLKKELDYYKSAYFVLIDKL